MANNCNFQLNVFVSFNNSNEFICVFVAIDTDTDDDDDDDDVDVDVCMYFVRRL